jgi:hypothetical protein
MTLNFFFVYFFVKQGRCGNVRLLMTSVNTLHKLKLTTNIKETINQVIKNKTNAHFIFL